MSVTYTLAIASTDAWQVVCGCGVEGPLCATPEAYTDFVMHWELEPFLLPGCTDELCLEYRPFYTVVASGTNETPLAVETAKANQRVVLEALGLDADEAFGSTSADDFEGRILMALAVLPESAYIPEHLEPGPGATVINAARAAGYVQEVLMALQPLAQQARRLNRTITWG